MKKFYLHSIGNGSKNLVLIHGYGFDSTIWFYLIKKLKKYYKIYVIDLPGFGKNRFFPVLKFNQLIKLISLYMPPKAIWMGWSLGGLIVNKLALTHPERISSIINVSSSPYFLKKKNWPGLEYSELLNFKNQLKKNYKLSVKNFFQEQKLNNKENVNPIYWKNFQKKMLATFSPSNLALEEGFKILCSIDLRKEIKNIKIPLLRIYGSLDLMVPKKISNLLDLCCYEPKSIIIKKASHAPFISHLKQFCKIILLFSKQLTFKKIS
ncbi:pimeloyl-ACP methyl ester esterase BioH [Buchnera aphidicola (Mindarus keteleerifoliae)]|uniref:pimeloyl-ACP methyl ester esterase BioH n=1 Tax=Buchnera aphidicola TaxID=9 RepID=UPI0031B6D6F9